MLGLTFIKQRARRWVEEGGKREQTKTKLRIEGSNVALTLVKSEQLA